MMLHYRFLVTATRQRGLDGRHPGEWGDWSNTGREFRDAGRKTEEWKEKSPRGREVKEGRETSAQPDPESRPMFDLCCARVCVSHVPFLAPPTLFFFLLIPLSSCHRQKENHRIMKCFHRPCLQAARSYFSDGCRILLRMQYVSYLCAKSLTGLITQFCTAAIISPPPPPAVILSSSACSQTPDKTPESQLR